MTTIKKVCSSKHTRLPKKVQKRCLLQEEAILTKILQIMIRTMKKIKKFRFLKNIGQTNSGTFGVCFFGQTISPYFGTGSHLSMFSIIVNHYFYKQQRLYSYSNWSGCYLFCHLNSRGRSAHHNTPDCQNKSKRGT